MNSNISRLLKPLLSYCTSTKCRWSTKEGAKFCKTFHKTSVKSILHFEVELKTTCLSQTFLVASFFTIWDFIMPHPTSFDENFSKVNLHRSINQSRVTSFRLLIECSLRSMLYKSCPASVPNNDFIFSPFGKLPSPKIFSDLLMAVSFQQETELNFKVLWRT